MVIAVRSILWKDFPRRCCPWLSTFSLVQCLLFWAISQFFVGVFCIFSFGEFFLAIYSLFVCFKCIFAFLIFAIHFVAKIHRFGGWNPSCCLESLFLLVISIICHFCWLGTWLQFNITLVCSSIFFWNPGQLSHSTGAFVKLVEVPSYSFPMVFLGF